MVGGRNTDEQEVELGYKASRPASSDSLPPMRLHLPNVSDPFQTSIAAGDTKCSNTYGDTSHSNFCILFCLTSLKARNITSAMLSRYLPPREKMKKSTSKLQEHICNYCLKIKNKTKTKPTNLGLERQLRK